MAGSFNKVILLGNLTRDIEMRQTGSGLNIGRLGLAVNDRVKDQSGQWTDKANFIDCVAFGRTAEIMSQYLGKGSSVFIEGKLSWSQWQDKNSGQNRSKLEVIVDNFQFVDSRQDRQGGGGGGYSGGGRSQPTSQAEPAPAPAHQFEPVSEDDIPF
ncbi:MAG: single-stranded DNA-binding protein [Planctomycetota bacterium]